MEIAKVIDGKISVEGFADGETVIVRSPNEEKPHQLTPEQKQAILKSREQLLRGEGVDVFDVLDQLPD